MNFQKALVKSKSRATVDINSKKETEDTEGYLPFLFYSHTALTCIAFSITSS